MERVLEDTWIDRHGALGDIVLSTGLFAVIRAYHENVYIVVLISFAFVSLFSQNPYFNEV